MYENTQKRTLIENTKQMNEIEFFLTRWKSEEYDMRQDIVCHQSPINLFFKQAEDGRKFKLNELIKRRKSKNPTLLKLVELDGLSMQQYHADKIFSSNWSMIEIDDQDLKNINKYVEIKKEEEEKVAAKQKTALKEAALVRAARDRAAREEAAINSAAREADAQRRAAQDLAAREEADKEKAKKRKEQIKQEFPDLFTTITNSNFDIKTVDRLVSKLNRLKNKDYISHNEIKAILRESNDEVWARLIRGKKPLETFEECEQYWHSYSGLMSDSLEQIFNNHEPNIAKNFNSILSIHSPEIKSKINSAQIIDYGCGQGSAIITMLDKFSKTNIKSITLIEKSNLALNLAKTILSIHSPEFKSRIKTFNSEIDNIHSNYFDQDEETVTIHLFSNILDIGVVDIDGLLNKINKNKGMHLFIASSMDSENYSNEISKFDELPEKIWLTENKFRPIGDKTKRENNTIEGTSKSYGVMSFIAYAEVI